jgi:enoyl-CoA hydratase
MLYQGSAFRLEMLPGNILKVIFDLKDQSANVFNSVALTELGETLEVVKKQHARGLLFTSGKPGGFVFGADVTEFLGHFKKSETELTTWLKGINDIFNAFEDLPYPKVALVNGFALGGGFEMAMSCDFILASKNAVFGLPEVKLGLIPGFGGTQRLMKIVGERRAKEMMFSGRNITSEEAKNVGIALEIYADKNQLISEAQNWFKNTLKNSSHAIAQAKSVLGHGLTEERKAFGNIFQTEEMIEGTAAFLEKRKAQFKGKKL